MAADQPDVSQGVPWQPASWYEDPDVLAAPVDLPPPPQAEGWDWRPNEWDLPDPSAEFPGAATLPEAAGPPQGAPGPVGLALAAQTPDSIPGGGPGPQGSVLEEEPTYDFTATPEEPTTYDFSPEEAAQAEDAFGRAEAQRLARDPLALAQEQARAEAETQRLIGERSLKKERDIAETRDAINRAALKRDERMRQWEARAAELSKTGGDRRTGFQKVAGVIAAAIGGMFASRNGGRNPALEMLQKQLADDFQNQMDQLKEGRGAIADEYRTTQDLYGAQVTYQMAELAAVEDQVRKEMGKLDPLGTRARRAAELIAGVKAEQQKLAVAAQKTAHDQSIDQAQLDIQRRNAHTSRLQAAETARHNRETAAETARHNLATEAPAGGVSPQDRLAHLRGVEKEIDIGHKLAGRTVQFGEKPIGEARSNEEAQLTRARVANYLQHQEEMTELINMVSEPDGSAKKYYQGPGWEMVPNAERDAVMAKAFNVLYSQAKINDPTTGVKDFELKMTGKMLPFVQGLLSGRSPAESAKEVLEQSDNALDKWIDSEVIGGVKNIPKGANPIEAWKATRATIAETRAKQQTAATTNQSFDVLLATAKQGTPDVAVKEFVRSKEAVLKRWVADSPWVFEGLNAENIKARWARDPSMTDAQKEKLGARLDEAIRSALIKTATNPGRSVEGRARQQQDEADREDEE